MVPARGIEPRVHPYHGCVLPLYYAGKCIMLAYCPIESKKNQLKNEKKVKVQVLNQ